MKKIIFAALLIAGAVPAMAQTTTAPSGADAACKAAIAQMCPGVKPGDGRIKACLQQHNTSFKQVCPGVHVHGKGGGAATTAPQVQAPSEDQ